MVKEIVIIFGLVLSFLGLAGIISIGVVSIKIRKEESGNSFDKKKNKSFFETLIIINYVALLTAFSGLIVIVIGLIIT